MKPQLEISNKTDVRIILALKILLGLCLALPIFVSSAWLFPYTGPKAFAFRIVIEAAAVLYLYLCFKYPVFRPSKNIIFLAVIIFLGVSFLSAIFGVDFYASFWGNLERMGGVWGLAHFVLFFLMLSVFKKEGDWLNLFKLSVAAGSLVAVSAIFQKFGDLGLLLPRVDERVFGLIGNSAFLAAYLLFNIFFAAYLFWRVNRPGDFFNFEKIVYAAAILLALTAFILSGTRGAMLGLLAGLLFGLALAVFFWPGKKQRRYFLTALTVLLVLAGLIFAFRQSPVISQNDLLSRFTSLSWQGASAQSRLLLWQRAWEAWRERPVFGWGDENYDVAINKYFDPRLNPYESWYDRAHNFIFDYGVVGGWLGLLSYLGLLAAALFCLNKIRQRQGNDFYLVPIFGGLLVGYAVQNLFVFDSFAAYLMLFFFFGFMNFACQKTKNSAPASHQPIVLSSAKKMLLAVSFIAIIIFIYSFNLKPILASRSASEILASSGTNYGSSDGSLEKLLAVRTFASDELTYQVAIDALAKINQNPGLAQDEKFYKLVSQSLLLNINQSPLKSRNYVALAWLDLYFSGQDSARIKAALDLGRQIKKLSLAKKDAYLILAAGYFLQGDRQNSQAVIDEAAKIDRQLGEEVNKYVQDLFK